MGLEVVILSEVSQTKKDTYHLKHLNVESLRIVPMNLFIKQK